MSARILVLAGLALLLLAAPARAGTIVDRAARAFAQSPVYVAPQAQDVLSPSDADRVRRRIEQVGAGPEYVAVLPAAALDQDGGSIDQVLRDLAQTSGRSGVYAVVAGSHFRAGGTDISVRQAATDAYQAKSGEGIAAVLLDFTDRVGRIRSGNGGDGGSGGTGGSGDGGGGGAGAIVLLVLVALGGGALILSRRRRRGREAAAMAELKDNARDDLVALGDDIRALDLDVQMPDADPEAKAAYAQAVEAYDRADSAWERARTPEDLEPVSAALEEGRWAMAAAKAHMEGRPVPERRPPCFFDPRHGPSSREVEWAPPGGAPRMVPACEADAQRVERGEDPESREVLVGGQRMPYWNAGPMYAPWAGGFFGGFGGGLLPGLLMGTLLGQAIAPPVVYGGDWGDGGDFGGGDFGGGDFGGGDFGGGGGDFGGGDFGGGDF